MTVTAAAPWLMARHRMREQPAHRTDSQNRESDTEVIPAIDHHAEVAEHDTLTLSAATWRHVVEHPETTEIAVDVWRCLRNLEQAGENRQLLAAVRLCLVLHQPTRGRCRTCRRHHGRHQLWPCVQWRQVAAELFG